MPRPQAAGTEFEDRADALVHTQAEDLHREHIVEPVGDQPGQSVSLGVEHAIGRGLGVQTEHLDAQVHRPVDLLLPERWARRLGLARRASAARSGSGGSRVRTQRLAVAVDDPDQVARDWGCRGRPVRSPSCDRRTDAGPWPGSRPSPACSRARGCDRARRLLKSGGSRAAGRAICGFVLRDQSGSEQNDGWEWPEFTIVLVVIQSSRITSGLAGLVPHQPPEPHEEGRGVALDRELLGQHRLVDRPRGMAAISR